MEEEECNRHQQIEGTIKSHQLDHNYALKYNLNNKSNKNHPPPPSYSYRSSVGMNYESKHTFDPTSNILLKRKSHVDINNNNKKVNNFTDTHTPKMFNGSKSNQSVQVDGPSSSSSSSTEGSMPRWLVVLNICNEIDTELYNNYVTAAKIKHNYTLNFQHNIVTNSNTTSINNKSSSISFIKERECDLKTYSSSKRQKYLLVPSSRPWTKKIPDTLNCNSSNTSKSNINITTIKNNNNDKPSVVITPEPSAPNPQSQLKGKTYPIANNINKNNKSNNNKTTPEQVQLKSTLLPPKPSGIKSKNNKRKKNNSSNMNKTTPEQVQLKSTLLPPKPSGIKSKNNKSNNNKTTPEQVQLKSTLLPPKPPETTSINKSNNNNKTTPIEIDDILHSNINTTNSPNSSSPTAPLTIMPDLSSCSPEIQSFFLAMSKSQEETNKQLIQEKNKNIQLEQKLDSTQGLGIRKRLQKRLNKNNYNNNTTTITPTYGYEALPTERERVEKHIHITDPFKVRGRAKRLTEEELEEEIQNKRQKRDDQVKAIVVSDDFEKDMDYYNEVVAFAKKYKYNDIDITKLAPGPVMLRMPNHPRDMPLLGLVKANLKGASENNKRDKGKFIFLYDRFYFSPTPSSLIAILSVVEGEIRVMMIVHSQITGEIEAIFACILKCETNNVIAQIASKENILPEYSGEVMAIDSTIDKMWFKSKIRTYHKGINSIEAIGIRLSSFISDFPEAIGKFILKEIDKLKSRALMNPLVQNRIATQKAFMNGVPARPIGIRDPTIFKCRFCHLNIRNEEKLTAHSLTCNDTTPEEALKCKRCPRKYKTWEGMLRHLAVHTRPKLTCPDCPETFTYASHLRMHSSIHTGIFQFNCDVGNCSFKTNRVFCFRRHRAVHDKSEIHPCYICRRVFYTRGRLAKHMKLHRKRERLVCEFCGKSFLQSRTLRKHILTFHKNVEN